MEQVHELPDQGFLGWDMVGNVGTAGPTVTDGFLISNPDV
jgi:hypothetical protein